MAIFKEHKVRVNDLLSSIPEALLSHLSSTTGVDYYTKVLHGRKMFYLLMYGILENDRLSQRTLEDTFNDPAFKLLFNLEASESVRRSSISERLSKISPEYFRDIYEFVYERFSSLYNHPEGLKYNIIRVDSSLVSETCSKLADGLENGSGKKAVKYSVAFDGILPGLFKIFSSAQYGSEDKALPKVIREHAFKEDGRLSIYVIDRGLQSSRNMQSFCNERIVFIVRAKENRKYVELESMIDAQSETDLGNLVLLKDSKVYLYAKNRYKTKNGKTYNKMEVVEEPLRLIIACDKEDNEKQYWFITNEFTISPKEVADTYRRRWDIEVFFRFLKQELNLSHLVSMNKNGIEVMLYMTLIVAMLVLIYKHGNNIGYKTAKRRLVMEFRDLIIALIVIECGGNPNIFFKT